MDANKPPIVACHNCSGLISSEHTRVVYYFGDSNWTDSWTFCSLYCVTEYKPEMSQ